MMDIKRLRGLAVMAETASDHVRFADQLSRTDLSGDAGISNHDDSLTAIVDAFDVASAALAAAHRRLKFLESQDVDCSGLRAKILDINKRLAGFVAERKDAGDVEYVTPAFDPPQAQEK